MSGHFPSMISHRDVVAALFKFASDNKRKRGKISVWYYRNVDNELKWDFRNFSYVEAMV